MDGAQIAIESGDAAWEQAAPLFAAVWPPEVRATFSWAHVIWANAERRVMVRNGAGALIFTLAWIRGRRSGKAQPSKSAVLAVLLPGRIREGEVMPRLQSMLQRQK